ncbi:response regulator transcription factor [Sulfurirhabdus autotrophica]|uniref:Two-component system chemotaxis response regulator CheY n=2 Tax=Sulfurirhabdus autotrophica TaxID=1706046 RepID=A0A4R3Y717_9PROT|nr:response regulator transcription factor [Sulfurirhabdus autotrophica]TCV87412.1 two-component system chemotaxis response regulator CheY [Sulfurirhabdus autotrophica]
MLEKTMEEKQRYRILIADDDGITRHLLRLLLKQYDHEVVGEADDGETTLTHCARLLPDVVFLDINMPNIDGIEVLKKIRQNHPQITVVMVSVSSTPDHVHTAMSLGAHEFIVKPFNSASVINTLNNIKRTAQDFPKDKP